MKNPTQRKDLPLELQHLPIEYLDEMMSIRMESWVKQRIKEVGDYREVSMSTIVIYIFKEFIEYIDQYGMDAFPIVWTRRRTPKTIQKESTTTCF